jgi:hypothetical protein
MVNVHVIPAVLFSRFNNPFVDLRFILENGKTLRHRGMKIVYKSEVYISTYYNNFSRNSPPLQTKIISAQQATYFV